MIYSTRRRIFGEMLANRSSVLYSLLLLVLVFFCTNAPINGESTSGYGCERIWRSRLNLGLNDGFQLRACCNFSSVYLRPFSDTSKWELEDDKFSFNFQAQNDFYSDVELFDCTNNKGLVSGYVESTPNVTCKQLQAQILNVPSDAIQLNRWFLVCNEHKSGCEACHLDVFCENEFSSSCADVYMQSSVSSITNDSMTLWIEMGRSFPFMKDTNIQITVRSQSRNAVVGRFQKTPQTLKKLHMNITDLQPDEWYLVSACLVISPPTRFLDNYGISFASPSKPLLCREGSHHTLFTKSATMSSFSFAIFAVAIFSFVYS
ncbi:hypothetical protein L596_003112 [Steinernema carpocapsae]|uniref:Fibronectin type-III domain-containing protein n=1 Tax=Steinernema carpocapsae TaxID=34508 RepID=A0A4V6I7X3_STECR|nr:hypothetical protein L596_003112 [Steinernema carpocapsae]